MSDIISKIPSSMLVNDTADAAQVNKALLNQVQGSNKIIDAVNTVNAAVNTVNAAVTAVGSGIVELGTNSNGTYIKWGNGLMVCYIINKGSSWTFPSAFTASPALFSLPNSTSGTQYTVSILTVSATSCVVDTNSGSSLKPNVNFLAIGMYK